MDSQSGTAATGDEPLVVGIDFGTLSGRAVVVRVSDGAELGSAVHEYERAVIEDVLPGTGERLPPDWALQDPDDWRQVLRLAVPAALRAAGADPAAVAGIATDFTACTVLPTLRDGTPLCESGFADRPHSWPKLWKHHAAQPEADRINELAASRGEPWLPRYGGRISSEWEFAKALQVLDEDQEVYDRIERWIEAADWIVWQLTGTESRNMCTAGYKGIYQDGQWPGQEYLAALDPRFAGFAQTRIAHPLQQLGDLAGRLTARAAGWTGLPEGTPVAVGNVDAHVTVAAARAVEPGSFVAIMGTSTCHVMNSGQLAEVPGMCGVVDGGITPGAWGYEAGQSAVGDILGWYVREQVPGSYAQAAADRGLDLHEYLSELAQAQQVGQHGLLALDWHGGNRSILVDHDLSGVVLGLRLSTRPEEVYRALVEATAFGTRLIIETFEAAGVPVERFVAAGGLLKNRFLMQVYADVLRRSISLLESAQGPALGAAIHAAVAAGCYPSIAAASAAMGQQTQDAYLPDEHRADLYDLLYAEYRQLHDLLGRGDTVLHRLHRIRADALAHPSRDAAGAAGADVTDDAGDVSHASAAGGAAAGRSGSQVHA